MAISCLGGNTTSILAPSRPVVVVHGHLVTRKEVVVYANTVHRLQSVIILIESAVSPTALDGFPFFLSLALEAHQLGLTGRAGPSSILWMLPFGHEPHRQSNF